MFREVEEQQGQGGEYVAAVERKPGKALEDYSPRFFDDLLECLPRLAPPQELRLGQEVVRQQRNDGRAE